MLQNLARPREGVGYLVCCHSSSTAYLSTSGDDILVPAWGARLYNDKNALCGIPQVLDSLPPLCVTGELTQDVCSCDQVILLVASASPAIMCALHAGPSYSKFFFG